MFGKGVNTLLKISNLNLTVGIATVVNNMVNLNQLQLSSGQKPAGLLKLKNYKRNFRKIKIGIETGVARFLKNYPEPLKPAAIAKTW